ncbi:hypothetical protein HPB50_012519 [Hyalomma asiaticum]|uniref:Uncharacterized protein n=1 Tax=Hyalomma asiaticum TaxID=266040 RepID=A0ACB7RKJ0_HYAAI|nr:hypothetical protein HPB50_012519 [Hyalomma asiaticum]
MAYVTTQHGQCSNQKSLALGLPVRIHTVELLKLAIHNKFENFLKPKSIHSFSDLPEPQQDKPYLAFWDVVL